MAVRELRIEIKEQSMAIIIRLHRIILLSPFPYLLKCLKVCSSLFWRYEN